MLFLLKPLPLLIAGCLAAAAQAPSWKGKPVKSWDAEDVREVLTDSPWSQKVAPQWVRDLSPDERRQGGDMEADMGKGVGLAAIIGIFGGAGADAAIARAHEKPDPGTVMVRWESADAVRAAERTLPNSDAPEIDSGEYYAIVVYNMPINTRPNLPRQLKGIAFLKRYQKKDLKPARVEVLRKDGGVATLVYLFPRSEEITKRDGSLIFQAQVGRMVVTRIFSTNDMLIDGQLEL
jgi:hypothetical protein